MMHSKLAVVRHPPTACLQGKPASQELLHGILQAPSKVADPTEAPNREALVLKTPPMVSLNTSRPNALLAALKAAIDANKITTWAYTSDGDFTHTPIQWKGKAFMRPSTVTGAELRFAIVCPKGGSVGTEIYAIYHGRFTEMMLAHFDGDFVLAAASAMPKPGDIVRDAA